MPFFFFFFGQWKTGRSPTGGYLKIPLLFLKPGVCLNKGEVSQLWWLNSLWLLFFCRNFPLSVGSMHRYTHVHIRHIMWRQRCMYVRQIKTQTTKHTETHKQTVKCTQRRPQMHIHTHKHTSTCTQCGPALGSQACNEALVKVYQGGWSSQPSWPAVSFRQPPRLRQLPRPQRSVTGWDGQEI